LLNFTVVSCSFSWCQVWCGVLANGCYWRCTTRHNSVHCTSPVLCQCNECYPVRPSLACSNSV